jgi:hypothetical protein
MGRVGLMAARHKVRLGLLVPGAIVFGISYGVMVFGGLIELGCVPTNTPGYQNDGTGCTSSSHTQGVAAVVPVFGPLLMNEAGPHTATDTKVALAWSCIEAVGLAALIAGIIGHDVPGSSVVAIASPARVSVIPLVTPEGGMLSLGTRW